MKATRRSAFQLNDSVESDLRRGGGRGPPQVGKPCSIPRAVLVSLGARRKHAQALGLENIGVAAQ